MVGCNVDSLTKYPAIPQAENRVRNTRIAGLVFFALLWLVPLASPFSADAGVMAHGVTFFTITAVVAALTARAALGTRRHERFAWGLLSAGATLTAVRSAVALLTGLGTGSAYPSTAPLAATMWGLALTAYFAATLLFVESPLVSTGERLRRSIDFALLVFFVTTSVFAFILYPMVGRFPGHPLGPSLILAASLVFGVSLLGMIVSLRPRIELWLVPLVSALVLTSIGSALATLVVLVNGQIDAGGQITSLPALLTYLLVAYAAHERISPENRLRRNYVVAVKRRQLPWGFSLTLLMFLALPVFVYAEESWRSDRLGQVVFSTAIAAYVITAVARNLVIAVENSSLRRRSTTDPLTGLFNHRHFHERLDAELARTERDTAPLSVAIMDVDDFDRVNNIYGHAVGDRRLRSIADRLFAGARGADIVCRLGGDEFAIVMPDTDPVEAYKACLRLQDELRQPDGVCPLATAVSIGVASAPLDASTREELVQKADGALYWAKFHGREQVVIFDAALVQALGPEQRIAMLQEEAYLNMVQMLASAVDARDPYTQRHSGNVAALAVALAEELGFSEAHAAELQTAALLHDVGKIGIPDAILRKAEQLTAEERAQVAEHPHLAARILSATPRREILPWIEAHHERWDGAGYPRGLAGAAIPLEARIIALCDAYDAITTDRPYRTGRSRAEARRELIAHAGSQFDPELTVRFVSLVERREDIRARALAEAMAIGREAVDVG